MEGLLERNTTIENAEKERHNATISERYRQLFTTVEDQLSTVTQVETPVEESTPAYASTQEVAFVGDSVEEHTPTVREYAPSALEASVFTTEKLERAERFAQMQNVEIAPTQPQTVVKTATGALTQYSLSAFAKVAMALFTLVVVAMLTLIAVNSQIIQRKSIRLKNLEEQKQELMEKNEEIQKRIRELQSEENIIERATEAGLLN